MIYRVVTAPTVEALEQEVNRLMECGWAVIGGLGVAQLRQSLRRIRSAQGHRRERRWL